MDWLKNQYPMQHLSSINTCVQSKLLPFTGLPFIRKQGLNSENQRICRGGARRPALGAFLRDIDGKIAGIPQCHALGTTLRSSISVHL